MWGQIAAAAIGAGSQMLGGGASAPSPAPAPAPAAPAPVSVLGTSPAQPMPTPPPRPSKPKRILNATNNFLGSEVGRLASGTASQFLGDYRARQANKNRYADLKKEGLTPQEIAGGSSGGNVGAQNSSLGNAPQASSKSQREHEISKTKIATKPAQIQADTAIMRLQNDIKVTPYQIIQIQEQSNKLMQETVLLKIQSDNFFKILASKMGPDNMMAAASMHMHGVDFESVITSIAPKTPEQIQALQAFWKDLNSSKSGFYRSVLAASNLVSGGINDIKNKFKGK